MTGAMYAAVSGLRAHMNALNVIGENISNVNTLGYKAARYTFNEALYTTSRSGSNGNNQNGGVNPAQVGYGSSIGTIDLDMSTKIFSPTGLGLDCMIDGDGMFILGDKTHATGIKTQEQLQGMNLSRLGNFTFDANGWLTDGNGSVVYGFLCTGYNPVTEEYTYSPTLTAIRAPNCTNIIKKTKDQDGRDIEVVQTNVYYPGVSDGSTIGYEQGDTMDGIKPQLANGVDADGYETIESYTDYTVSPPVKHTAADPSGDADENHLTTLLNAYKAVYDANGNVKEGVVKTTDEAEEYKDLLAQAKAKGERVSLSSCSIDKTGRIIGTTQDDKQVVVGFVALAKADNPNGLTHTDGRYFQALGGAGNLHLCSVGGTVSYVPNLQPDGSVEPLIDHYVDDEGNIVTGDDVENATPVYKSNDVSAITVESSGDTVLISGGLEGSGTDLATEISNMIMIQRGYQANTRIVTVTDSMLEELVNMKR